MASLAKWYSIRLLRREVPHQATTIERVPKGRGFDPRTRLSFWPSLLLFGIRKIYSACELGKLCEMSHIFVNFVSFPHYDVFWKGNGSDVTPRTRMAMMIMPVSIDIIGLFYS